jgi:hypothetical protein
VSTADAWGNVVARASGSTVTLSNNQSNALLQPASHTLSIAAGTAQSSASLTQSRANGNTTYTVTAASSGLSPVSCGVTK